MNTSKKFSRRVREEREGRGLTVNELAKLSNVSLRSVYNVEEGKSPTLDTMEKLAKGLRVSVLELIK